MLKLLYNHTTITPKLKVFFENIFDELNDLYYTSIDMQ